MDTKDILYLIVHYGHLFLSVLTYLSSRKKEESDKDVKGKKKTREY